MQTHMTNGSIPIDGTRSQSIIHRDPTAPSDVSSPGKPITHSSRSGSTDSIYVPATTDRRLDSTNTSGPTAFGPDGTVATEALGAVINALAHHAWPTSRFFLNLCPAICKALGDMGVHVRVRHIADRNLERSHTYGPSDSDNTPSIRVTINEIDGQQRISVEDRFARNIHTQSTFDCEKFLEACHKAVDRAYKLAGNVAPAGCTATSIRQDSIENVRANPGNYLYNDDEDSNAFIREALQRPRVDARADARRGTEVTFATVNELATPGMLRQNYLNKRRLDRDARDDTTSQRTGLSHVSRVTQQSAATQHRVFASATRNDEADIQSQNQVEQSPLDAAGQPGIASPFDENEPFGGDVPPYCPVPDGINAPPRFYDLQELQETVAAHNERPIDMDAIAALFNEVRHYGPAFHQGSGHAAVTDHHTLMQRVTDDVENRFFRALGFDEKTVDQMYSSAFKTGMLNPLGSLPGMLCQYVVAPTVSPDGGRWASLGLSAFVAMLNPFLTGVLQTAVVETLAKARSSGGLTIEQSKNINDKKWLANIAKELGTATQTYLEHIAALQQRFDEVAQKYGIPPDDAAPQAAMAALLAAATPQESTDLANLAAAAKTAEATLHKVTEEVFSSQSSLKKQFWGNFCQGFIRTIRAPGNAAFNLLKGDQAKAVVQTMAPGATTTSAVQGLTTATTAWAGRAQKASDWAIYGAQVATALSLFGAQMFGAGIDERAKQKYAMKANIATGNLLTAAGKQRWLAGQSIRAQDVDADAVKGTVLTPPQSLAKQVLGVVEFRVKEAQALCEKYEAKTTPPRYAVRTVTPRTLEEGRDAPSYLTDQEYADYEAAKAALPEMKADLALMKKGLYGELKPDGFAGSLLLGHPEAYFSKLLSSLIRNKYHTNNEMAAQIVQRCAQGAHLVLFGSAGAIVLGKLIVALLGGSSKVPSKILAPLLALSLTQGAVGAFSQSAAINMKNYRRTGEDNIGNGGQFLRSMFAAPLVMNAHHQANKSVAGANQALDQSQQMNFFAQYMMDIAANGPSDTAIADVAPGVDVEPAADRRNSQTTTWV